MFAPNSTIRLMKGVPLDSAYRNTIWFDNEEEQTNHFLNAYDYKLFSNQTYQRYARGTLRISALADELYDYNYLAFRNNVNGVQGKIFYCFINSIEYIAERTTEIKYEIDYMQTYFFDYDLGDCFVEREHSVTDEIGENIIPEGLEIGEYISGEPTYISNVYNSEGYLINRGLDKLDICVASSVDFLGEDIENAVAGVYNGLPSGVSMIAFDISENGIQSFNEFLTKIITSGKTEAIVSVFLVPESVVLQSASGQDNITGVSEKEFFSKPKNYSLIHRDDGKPIKNNKMFVSPYNFLYVTNMQGNSCCYAYEFFSGDNCDFQWFGNFSPNPSVALLPNNYKGVSENYDEKMILSGYPQLSFNVDTYRAWLAQNRGTLAVNALSNISSVAIGYISGSTQVASSVLSGDVSGMISSGIQQYSNMLTSAINYGVKTASILAAVKQRDIMPSQSKGGGDPLLMASANMLNFMFMPKYIRPDFVTIIDDYFNMYGYATKKVKKPNTHSRPFWNYVKTIGCNVFPKTSENSLPSLASVNIKKIYDNGITFWKKTSKIGDYTQNNSPR